MKSSTLILSLLACLLISCTPVPRQVVSDLVIADHQTWKGEVRVNGLVRVTRSGSLTLLPGTRILFERFDRDADGIGDAELFVEGKFYAIGTTEKPILLSSAAADPQAGDWKFLYFDYAQQVDIAYLIAEYAFSGVQVHFCKAQIENSEFRHNIDGVRFSTANISLKNSYLHHNRHGIRYEERGGRGLVQHNRISDNQIGIFAVTRATGRTVFEWNDIQDNIPYQVKMGVEQRTPLDFPRNWWGDVSGLSPETVFDQGRDRSLGRVTGSDPLMRPIQAISQ